MTVKIKVEQYWSLSFKEVGINSVNNVLLVRRCRCYLDLQPPAQRWKHLSEDNLLVPHRVCCRPLSAGATLREHAGGKKKKRGIRARFQKSFSRWNPPLVGRR